MRIPDGAKIFIYNQQLNKHLFVLRDAKADRPDPNCWSLFGGAIEEGETPHSAVLRELAEESNLQVANIKYLCTEPQTLKIGGKTVESKVNYLRGDIAISKTSEIELKIGQRIGFFSLAEISKLENITPSIKNFFNKHIEMLDLDSNLLA